MSDTLTVIKNSRIIQNKMKHDINVELLIKNYG